MVAGRCQGSLSLLVVLVLVLLSSCCCVKVRTIDNNKIIADKIMSEITNQQNRFEEQRRLWRTPFDPTTPIHRAPSATIDEVDDIFSDHRDRVPFPSRLRMSDMVEFLKVYWPEVDNDYPSPERLWAMRMDELIDEQDPFYIDVAFALISDDRRNANDPSADEDSDDVQSQEER